MKAIAAKFTIILLVAAAHTMAATPEDYFARVVKAEAAVYRVISGGATVAESPEAFAAEIKSILPETERIQWNGGSVETANAWLHQDLDQMVAAGSDSERRDIARRIRERLAGIASVEDPSAPAATKDAAKQKLDEILSRPEYQKPEAAEESLFQRWWREFLEWVASLFPRRPDVDAPSVSGIGSIQYVLQAVILLLVVGLVVFLIYKFAPLIRRRARAGGSDGDRNRVILGERIGADESATTIFSEAELLASRGDLRGAIRKGYVAVLCELADRKAVRLARHKTNRDYARDLANRRPLIDTFKTMTGRFERSWYGLQAAGPQDWEAFRDEYRRAVEQVGGDRK